MNLKAPKPAEPLTIEKDLVTQWKTDGYAGNAYVREEGPYNSTAYTSEKRMKALMERFKKDGLAEALFKTV
ncbi:hypothetical protein K1X76_05145 [bacterium]|nr:hypothetical protein [bacterium]